MFTGSLIHQGRLSVRALAMLNVDMNVIAGELKIPTPKY